jgi:acyl-CoA reductase-like NAD-dependent aldehyde dehydrogenase
MTQQDTQLQDTQLIALDALGPHGAYRARNRMAITDVAGQSVGELSLVPALFVSRATAALRKAGTLPVDERISAITRAGTLFATAVLNGLSVTAYENAVSRVAGVPISVVRATTSAIGCRLARAYRNVQNARPAGAVNDWRDPLARTGSAVWARRGEVFAVQAAGNHPGTHSLWPEALALGYKVAVRPSRREPFTPHRLVTALRAAGFGEDQVVLLPTDHDTADAVLRGADLGIVYGDENTTRRYGTSSRVLVQGPGRSKILLTADLDWREHLDTIIESVSHHGGTGCINASAVFVEGDPAPVAAAIAERLSAMPSLPPEDEKAVLPVQPVSTARKIEKHLLERASGTQAWLGGAGIVDELGDGSAVLRPAVHQVLRCDAPQVGIELPFPCVWVAPWTAADGVAPLRNTLALTALTRNERLIDGLLNEPTIGNLYLGDHATCWIGPGLPHDGYLADFLMRTKAVIRD